MLKYGKIKFNFDSLDPLSIDRQSLSLVPSKSSVLDIGCATGFLGGYLIKEKECYVVGVEKEKEEAKEAKKRLNKVIEGDIEDEKIYKTLGKFDVVFASAVIEHLHNPGKSLESWKKLLKNNGILILTTSNICHWSMRLEVLKGNFNYKDYGILDSTHLHFYTVKTFKKLLVAAGYKIEFFGIDSVGGGFPKISRFMSKFFPNLFTYQILIKARPSYSK